jgi:riboflavin synthase
VFTGIVEEVGRIADARDLGEGREFVIGCGVVREGLGLGDSVAVEGVCLTVTELRDAAFVVQAVATTLGRTTVGRFAPGTRVNLERAVTLGTRLGGHMVQGHVDGTGTVTAVRPRDEHTLIDVTLPEVVAAVTVLHGSITVNGISLTVNALPEPGVCQVSIIPYTWDHTSLPQLREGDAVNLEGDLIGKYVRHLLGAPAARAGGADLLGAWGYQGPVPHAAGDGPGRAEPTVV